MNTTFILNFSASIPSSPPTGPRNQSVTNAATEENLEFILPSDSIQLSTRSHLDRENRGLGTWLFDKKTRKRRYVSLTGKKFFGQAAVDQAKKDKISELHPAHSARAELRYLTATMAPNCLDDFFSSDVGGNSITPPLFISDPSALLQWGIPVRVVRKYSTLGISKLFQWQIDCLGVDDGNVLRGGMTYPGSEKINRNGLIAVYFPLQTNLFGVRGRLLVICPTPPCLALPCLLLRYSVYSYHVSSCSIMLIAVFQISRNAQYDEPLTSL
jgi:hypothetical protein